MLDQITEVLFDVRFMLGAAFGIIGWIRLGSPRFQFYALFEEVELTIKKTFWLLDTVELSMFGTADEPNTDTRPFNLSEFAKVMVENDLDARCYSGQYVRLLYKMHGDIELAGDVIRFTRYQNGTPILQEVSKSDFKLILKSVRDLAEQRFSMCLAQKQKLEGFLTGNWTTLKLLCSNRPITRRSILNDICKKHPSVN